LQAENSNNPEPGPWRHATECPAKRRTQLIKIKVTFPANAILAAAVVDGISL
jgi:hypothetical protein